MADQDIVFNAGINIDTSKASKNIQDFAKKVDDLFTGIASRVSEALNPNITHNGKRVSLSGLATSKERELDALWEKTPARIANAYLAIAKAQGKNPARYAKALLNSVKSLESFAPLPTRTQMLAQNIMSHVFDPQTVSGKYGALQADINKYIGLVNRTNYLFPGLVPEEGREEAYGLRNINLKHGNKARQLDRWLFNKEYQQTSTDQVRDYLLATSGRFQSINRRYGLGLESTGLPFSDDLDPIILDKYNTMLDLVDSIENRKKSITSGSLNRAEKNVELKGLRSDITSLARIGKSLGKIEEKATKEIKKTNDIFIEKNRGTGGTEKGIWTAISAKAAKDLFHAGAEMLESYWGESITRNAYASRQAYLSRWTKGGKVAGSIIGGILGGLIGGPVGAGIGYSTLGEVGQLFGKYSETKYQADIKSSSDMMARLRNKALWGNEYNTYFAKALTDVGIANGESAMGGLADRSMSMRARMMLGQVGEQEMLYMSMMPNYYAALMAGVTGPSLLNIYKRDLDAIGDPSMKYLVGQSIGNTEAFAAANSPYFNSVYSSTAGVTGAYEGALSRVQGGFVAGRMTAAMETLTRDFSEIFASVRRGEPTIYQGPGKNKLYQEALDQYKFLTGEKSLTVIVNVDGEEIKRSVVGQDQLYANDLQLYTVGG